jgi:hypothetical protein
MRPALCGLFLAPILSPLAMRLAGLDTSLAQPGNYYAHVPEAVGPVLIARLARSPRAFLLPDRIQRIFPLFELMKKSNGNQVFSNNQKGAAER